MQMYLNVGDWSEDGHNKYDRIKLDSNLPVADVQDAYRKACEITGMSFHNAWKGPATPNPLLTEYEEREIFEDDLETLRKHGVPESVLFEDEYYDPWMFADLWIEFARIGNPDLVMTQIEDKTPNINGYWDKRLNTTFGYGLYCL